MGEIDSLRRRSRPLPGQQEDDMRHICESAALLQAVTVSHSCESVGCSE